MVRTRVGFTDTKSDFGSIYCACGACTQNPLLNDKLQREKKNIYIHIVIVQADIGVFFRVGNCIIPQKTRGEGKSICKPTR